MKKLILSLLVVLMLTPMAHASFLSDLEESLTGVESFPDVPTDHINHFAIGWMSDEGIIDGYENGTFGPNFSVNRAELMKMVVGDLPDGGLNYKNCFPDVKDEWFAPYVCFAYEQGWVDGYPDGLFRPANNVNRAEAMKIILNVALPDDRWPAPTDAELAMILPSDVDTDEWYGMFAKFAFAKDLVDEQHVIEYGDGVVNYFPGGNMARKEVAEMIFRVAIYEIDRNMYALIMTEAGCFAVDNILTMSEDDLNTGIVAIFEDNGYSEMEMNTLTNLLELDEVVNADIAAGMQIMCPQ